MGEGKLQIAPSMNRNENSSEALNRRGGSTRCNARRCRADGQVGKKEGRECVARVLRVVIKYDKSPGPSVGLDRVNKAKLIGL